ncbi:UDP-N-acetyl-D-mannosamine dehydrogenase [Rhodospirillaceae bacterium SYSU D60014]|uniref:UDP-N-acetyl-D-mannosamine dehydrogenase n=1 Tax=Virgifigura deserti TaxID=2268457 RepID=UPI000E6622EB
MRHQFSKISVIGLGYIGLPTAATIASRGIEVVGVDVNDRAVSLINQGHVHFIEPDLDMLVRAAVTTGRLRALAKPEPAEAFIVAVPTPLTADKRPDLSYIDAAVRSIAPVLEAGNLVVLESTSPVGTTAQLAKSLAELRPDLSFPHEAGERSDIRIAYCPERILPGRMVLELVENDRIIGGLTATCAARANELYKTFVKGSCFLTDASSAELVKLTENAYRDVNIAFANELSMICDRLGVDVWRVIELSNRHPRVNILQPGPGVGGHCIAVDPWFIVDSVPEVARLIRTARDVNDGKPHQVVAKIRRHAERFKDPVIACLGLSYKANVDDLRESPAVDIVGQIVSERIGKVLAVEPHIESLPPALAGQDGLEFMDVRAALEKADIAVLLVDHNAFRSVEAAQLLNKIVIDTRGFWRDRLAVVERPN